MTLHRIFKVGLVSGLCVVAALSADAKIASPDEIDAFEAAGNYYCYPYLHNQAPELTPAPKGYKPFHIEHYGRHGSRWLIGTRQYDTSLKYLEMGERNGKLTPLGHKVLEAVRTIEKDSRKRDGELSDNGALQHRGIGKRMVRNFPQVFTPQTNIDAKSTVVIRCILSMLNGLDGIKSEAPYVNTKTDASYAEMEYMNHDDTIAWKIKDTKGAELKKQFNKRHANKGAFLSRIYSDEKFAQDSVGSHLASSLFSVLANTQSHSDQPWLLEEVFSPEEISERWKIRNVNWFVHGGNTKLTDNRMPYVQAPLVRNIIESADTAINSTTPSVNLRYGHDTIVLPLAVLLELDNFGEEINDLEALPEKGWHDYLIVPMAGNIQIVLFRQDGAATADDVLVKVLLNEREVTLPLNAVEGPYYRWSDFRKYYLNKIKDYN